MNAIRVVAQIVWLETLRRKDAYVLGILLAALVFSVSLLDAFGIRGSSRHVLDLGLLLAWLFALILALSIAGRQLPREEERGTILAMLSKPMTRWEWLLGKAWGCWGAVFSATTLFYAMVIGLAVLQGGSPNARAAIQAWLLHGAALAVLTAMALAISTRTTADAAWTLSAVLAAFLLFVVPSIPLLVLHAEPVAEFALSVLYFALPNLDLFDLRQRLVHDWGPIPWPVFWGIAAYALAWTGIWLAFAWLGFRNRRFNRKTA